MWIYHARGVQGLARRLNGVVMDLRGELATVTEWHVTAGATPAVAASAAPLSAAPANPHRAAGALAAPLR